MGRLPSEERDHLVEYEKTAHVTGVRRNRFVEFDFTVGAPELTVELVMPMQAFEEFCELNHVRTVTVQADAKKDYEQLLWREGRGRDVQASKKGDFM